MSVSAISSNNGNLWDTQSSNLSSKTKQDMFQQELAMLGQDLKSGKLSAAQSIFSSLRKSSSVTASTSTSSTSSTSSTTSTDTISKDFSQLSTDLQAGNLSAAKSDYAKLQQDFQNQAVQGHHHHHSGGGSETSEISQSLDQLAQALQTGSLSTAQTAYSALQNDLAQIGQGLGLSSSDISSTASSLISGLSLNA